MKHSYSCLRRLVSISACLIIAVWMMVFFLPLSAQANNGQDSRPILRIGYIENSFSPSERAGFEATFAYLGKTLSNYRIEIHRYLVKDLEEAVKNNRFEFFIGASGFYRRVFRRGLKDLATLTTPTAPDPNYAIGTVFLVAKDSRAKTLADLKGLRAAVNWVEGFSGVYVPLGEIAAQGFNPDNFFGELVSAGSPMKRLLEAVERKQADVAMARACTFEELQTTEPEFTARFRPIGLKSDITGFACMRSTELFPNWTFVATPIAPWQASRDMTAALLSMPKTENGMAWGVTSDFLRVDDLYKTLRVGPYAYLRIRSVSDFVERFWPWMIVALVGILALIFHSRYVSHLVDVRTRELKESVQKERTALEQVQKTKAKLESLERISVVGAMSSLITHELNGPVSAIANSCNALERHLEECDNPDKMTIKTTELVLRQCTRISEIVNHVRNYVRLRTVNREKIFVCTEIKKIVAQCRMRNPQAYFSISVPRDDLPVLFNRLEFELCMTNLLKNAVEACQTTGIEPRIDVFVGTDGKRITIEIVDNACTDAALLEANIKPLNSGKVAGLGLGLVIVRTLVEKSSGNFSIVRQSDKTIASVTLPCFE